MARQATGSKAERTRFMMIGGSVGAALVFIGTGIIEDLVKVALGGVLGVGIALGVWAVVAKSARQRQAERLLDLSKADLEQEARRLNVENPSKMNKADLAEAIVAKSDDTDSTGELMIEGMGAVQQKVGQTMGQAREKLAEHRGNASGSK